MLRPERQRLVDVGGQIGGALAGDPVDEIERDVVKVGITESVDARRTSSGAACRSSTERSRGWKLCAPSETRVTPSSRSSAASRA